LCRGLNSGTIFAIGKNDFLVKNIFTAPVEKL